MSEKTDTWLPFVVDREPLAANAGLLLRVADDDKQGLGEVGRAGKIENLGPGILSYQISDDGHRWMGTRSLQPNGQDIYSVTEKVKMYSIHVFADAIGCVCNVIITAKAPDVDEEEVV